MATVTLQLTAEFTVDCSQRDAKKYEEEGEIAETLERKVEKLASAIQSAIESKLEVPLDDFNLEVTEADSA